MKRKLQPLLPLLLSSQLTKPDFGSNSKFQKSGDDMKAQFLLEMDEEEYYNCDIGESSSGVLSSEPNSRENANVIVEEKVNSDDDDDKESKSCAISERPPTCLECGKTFRSMKSLYGHLRSHPNRGYRGAKPPKRKSFTKRGRRDDGLEARDRAAEILVMMSQYTQKPFSLRERDTWGYVDHTQALEEPMQIDDKIFQCSACGKISFNTHQALGGAHKKQKSTSAGERGQGSKKNAIVHDGPSGSAARGGALTVHKCKECHETFVSGQALAGHMRRHWTGPPSSVVVVSGEEENGRGGDRDCTGLPNSGVVSARERDCGFDLNQDAQFEE